MKKWIYDILEVLFQIIGVLFMCCSVMFLPKSDLCFWVMFIIGDIFAFPLRDWARDKEK